MIPVDRRRFLETSSLILSASYASAAFGDAGDQPTFQVASYEPTALFLTWQNDPTTTMTVHWIGAEGDATDRPIWFRESRGRIWQQQKPQARRFPMSDLWIYRTELTGLAPDTEYRFRVGLDTAEHRFRTMPAKATDTIHFVSGGDSGVGPAASQSNQIAAKQAPMFVVIGGDLAYENGRNPAVFLTFLKNYSKDLIDDDGRLIPMVAILGNHEVDGAYGQPREKAPFFYSIFDGLFKEHGFASLDFGDYLSLVLLDTNHTTPIGGEQTDWLEKTLKDREECPNVLVFNHVPAYPSVRSYDLQTGEGTGEENRKYWTPLFERYNVDVVFEHHDHAYKRTHPLLDGQVDKNGVLYLGDGSWGKIRPPKSPDDRPYLAKTDMAFHLSAHRIEGADRFHVALSEKGKVVDVCMSKKRTRS